MLKKQLKKQTAPKQPKKTNKSPKKSKKHINTKHRKKTKKIDIILYRIKSETKQPPKKETSKNIINLKIREIKKK